MKNKNVELQYSCDTIKKKSYKLRKHVLLCAKDVRIRSKTNLTLSAGLYLSRLTPTTYMGASAEGAEMITFLAPPSK